MSSVLGDPNALGADPDELERLAASMSARADVLDRHRVTLHAQIHQAPWLGLLADAFRREWQSSHYRVMAGAADALRSAATILRHRAEAQRKASAPDAQNPSVPVIGFNRSGSLLQGSSAAGLQGGDGGSLQGGAAVLLGGAILAAPGSGGGGSKVQDTGATEAADTGKPGDSEGTLPPSSLAEYEATVRRHPDPKWGELDQWGKAGENQCTSWAAYRRSEFGLSVPYGNGGDMGHDPNGSPTLGALASYYETPGATDPGHVMFVEQVMSPDKFRVSEMNFDNHGGFRDTQIWDRQPDGTWRSETSGDSEHLRFTP